MLGGYDYKWMKGCREGRDVGMWEGMREWMDGVKPQRGSGKEAGRVYMDRCVIRDTFQVRDAC